MTNEQAIKPILKYPGAKWNLAAWIISHFPAHQHYIEPYFGSGAVFFNKTPAKHEVINDLSGDVVNLFRVIREDGERLAALIEITPWAREEYELSYTPTDDPMERARRFVVRVWQTYGASGVNTDCTPQGWRHAGIDPVPHGKQPWRDIANRIRETAKRLYAAEIENRPATNVVSRYSSPDILIYADPPYVSTTRGVRRAQNMYQHEMTDADHLELLTCLDAHPGPVVLSGYHCALYDDRLSHWHTREKQAQAEKGNTRTEVLWLNQVCVDRLGMGPMFDMELAR